MRRIGEHLRWLGVSVAAALLASICLGCERPPQAPASAQPATAGRPMAEPLRIAAASDLQRVLTRVRDRFQAETGVLTVVTFGASGRLAEQIKAGAPFDLFLSANREFVQDLAAGGLVRGDSVRPYARGALALAVYREHAARIHSIADLTIPEIKKIAVANPATAPYGRAGKQSLERAGLWSRLEPRIVVADSVAQALLYAQKGDADAALVSRALTDNGGVGIVAIDPQLYDPIVQVLGVVSASKRGDDAERFARFLVDGEGQKMLTEAGFAAASSIPAHPAGDRSRP